LRRNNSQKNPAVANAVKVWFPCDKSRMSAVEPGPPGTGFLDAEAGHPKSPPETTCARRDQEDPKPVAQIPAHREFGVPSRIANVDRARA
jgi:hypothetical protein